MLQNESNMRDEEMRRSDEIGKVSPINEPDIRIGRFYGSGVRGRPQMSLPLKACLVSYKHVVLYVFSGTTK